MPVKNDDITLESSTETPVNSKRPYTKGPTRRFAIQFPLDLAGYCRVQTSKDNVSVYEIKRMKPLYQLGMADTLAIARFLILHDLCGGGIDPDTLIRADEVLILEQGTDKKSPVQEWLNIEA